LLAIPGSGSEGRGDDPRDAHVLLPGHRNSPTAELRIKNLRNEAAVFWMRYGQLTIAPPRRFRGALLTRVRPGWTGSWPGESGGGVSSSLGDAGASSDRSGHRAIWIWRGERARSDAVRRPALGPAHSEWRPRGLPSSEAVGWLTMSCYWQTLHWR
jgi:hypothetical protein